MATAISSQERCVAPLRQDFSNDPRRLVEAHARVAVALEEALDRDHQVGPHRLRAGVAAPHAPGDRRDEKQASAASTNRPVM